MLTSESVFFQPCWLVEIFFFSFFVSFWGEKWKNEVNECFSWGFVLCMLALKSQCIPVVIGGSVLSWYLRCTLLCVFIPYNFAYSCWILLLTDSNIQKNWLFFVNPIASTINTGLLCQYPYEWNTVMNQRIFSRWMSKNNWWWYNT